VELFFDKFPNLRDDKEAFEEIKKLLKKRDPDYHSLHFESK